LLGVAFLGLAAPAKAAYTVTLSQAGFSDLVIIDNVQNDNNPAVGAIGFAGDFGSFTGTATNPDGISIQSSTNGAATGNASSLTGFLTNTTVEVRNNSTGTNPATLTVVTSADNFTNPTTPLVTVDTLLQPTRTTGPGSITSSGESFLNGTSVGQVGPIPNTGFDEDIQTVAGPGGAVYTLSNTLTITAARNQSASVKIDTIVSAAAVPAPASLLMALTGTPLLGAYYWLRRRLNLRRLAIA